MHCPKSRGHLHVAAVQVLRNGQGLHGRQCLWLLPRLSLEEVSAQRVEEAQRAQGVFAEACCSRARFGEGRASRTGVARRKPLLFLGFVMCRHPWHRLPIRCLALAHYVARCASHLLGESRPSFERAMHPLVLDLELSRSSTFSPDGCEGFGPVYFRSRLSNVTSTVSGLKGFHLFLAFRLFQSATRRDHEPHVVFASVWIFSLLSLADIFY